MGAAMAKNLIKSGHLVTVCNRSGSGFEEFRALGADATRNPADTVHGDAVFMCLTNSKAVEAVFYGENGLLNTMRKGQVLVDFGTSRYDSTLRIADECKAKGIDFIDAPITGLPQRAEEGTLTIMCGGEEQIFEKMKPIFLCMGSKAVLMGKIGCGQLTKLVNQLLYNANMAALAEIMPMAVKLGLDPEQVTEVVNSGTGRSHASEFFLPRILNGNFEGGLAMEIAYKDMVSAMMISSEQKIPLPVFSAANVTYLNALQDGLGKYGKGAMICVFEKIMGVKFRKKSVSDS
jgi:3-hydroxyisobutyrate dehydrogenase-like beta-hydroxyacid dehydrogenase